jgi:glucosamine kinase
VLFAGIDGGQSSTEAAIGDDVRVLSHGFGGPADEVGAAPESTRMRDALEDALTDALRAAGLPPQTRFDAIVAGVSGYEGRVYGRAPQFLSDRFVLMHDAPIAHAGALGGEPGVVTIAGTGSVAYAVAADGRTQTRGGFGYLFGDEGSAFWIVRTLVSHAAKDESCACADALNAYFGVPNLRALVRAFYAGDISRDRLASFAAFAIRSAAQGDGCGVASEIVENAANEIALLARSAILEEPCKLAFTGGLVRDSWFEARVHAATRALVPRDALVTPVTGPAEGALILARRL